MSINIDSSSDSVPVQSLAEVLKVGVGIEEPITTQIAHNMGNSTFLFNMPMNKFYEKSLVANARNPNGGPVAQRELIESHTKELAKYILKGLVITAIKHRERLGKSILPGLTELEELLGKQPYVSIPPMICNLRNIDPSLENVRAEQLLSKTTNELVAYKVWLTQSHILYVVDGQHRRAAMKRVMDFLNNAISNPILTTRANLLMPLKGDLNSNLIAGLNELLQSATGVSTVQIECHLGLDIDQERQLFYDLNNLGKKVPLGQGIVFDQSNPINRYVTEFLMGNDSPFKWGVVEKNVGHWKSDNGDITMKDLIGINAMLFLNKNSNKGAIPVQVNAAKDLVSEFWTQVMFIPYLGLPGAKMASVAAQPVVLRALAKLAYDFGVGRKADYHNWKILLDKLSRIDFRHTNPMWRYYQLNTEERHEFGLGSLAEYLPSDDEGYNRDIGWFDDKAETMRFGSKHNDIFPIIGDMIRWRLSLPNRHKKVPKA